MPLFAVICRDKPGALQTRLDTREAHLGFIRDSGIVRMAGPLLENGQMCGSLLIALAWHFALPGVSIAMWLFLAAGRLLVSRLPLVPNKDLLFANFAILLIGQDQALSELVAFTAALTLLVHVILIVIFSGHAIAMRTRA